VRFEVLDLLQGNAANDTIAEGFDFDASFDDGLDVNAFAGAAIEFIDDDVLRDVDETAGQVARVRGLRAVSARPLRAPWVEMKYSNTVRPSRKFEVIGVSMTSPEGLAMRPRIPESWRICCSNRGRRSPP